MIISGSTKHIRKFLRRHEKILIVALGKLLKISGIARLIIFFKGRIRTPGCYILVYHRISDEADESVSATIENFSRQISFLNKHFSIISLERLIDSIENKKSLPLNSAVITFDDGYKDVFTNAYPILKKYNIPATIFITINLIDPSSINPLPPHLFLRELNCPEWALVIVGNRCGGMSWDDIREMSDNNISIGSHTVSHPVMSAISDNEIEREIRESKEIIEKNIGKEITCFAYPYGGRRFFDGRAKQILKKYRYKCGCSTIYGENDSESDPFELKRIPIEYYEDETIFMVKLFGLLNPIARFMDKIL